MERVKLRDITSKLQSGDGIKAGKIFEEGLFPVFGGNGLRGYTDTFNQDGEYFFIGRQGAKCGNVHYNIGKAFMTEHAVVGCPKEGYDAVYLAYKLSLLDLGKLQGQSAQPGLAVGTLADVELEIPEYRTQHDIGKLLYNIDQKISLNTRMNAELEAMAKQLYDYWFVQFDFPDVNGKPYKSSGGKMVWNENLKREIPEGWEVKELDDCIKHINTGLNPRQNFVLGNGDIKYLTVKNLRSDGTIDFSNCDVIDEEARKKVHRRSDIQVNDILFASIAPLGRSHLILKEPKDWDINESVFSIRPDVELVSPYYLFIYFMSNWFVQKAEKESAGSIFAGIRVNSLLNIPIIVPHNNIQNLFNKVVESNFLKRDSLSSEIYHLTHLRDSLLPMLMNGQVTIE